MGRKAVLMFLGIVSCCLFLLTSCEKSDAKNYNLLVKDALNKSVSRNMAVADSLLDKDKNEEALVYYMVICQTPQDDMTDADLQQCGLAHLNAGKIYYEKRNYAQALEYYVKGLKIYEKCRYQPSIAKFYNNIGTIYNCFKEYEKGMSYYREGYRLSIQHDDRETRYNLLTNMTNLSVLQDSLDNARKYLQMAEAARDTTNVDNNFMYLFNKMHVSSATDDYAKAIKTAHECLTYSISHKLKPEYEAYTYEHLYNMYSNLGNTDSALYYLAKAYDKSLEYNLPNLTVATLLEYGDMYERKGDLRRALECRTEYIAIRDSIYNYRDFDVAKNQQFLYEMDKTNRHIKDLNERDKLQKETIHLQRALIIGGVVLTTLILWLFFKVYRQKRNLDRSYESLYEVNQKSVAAQEQLKTRLHKAQEQLKEIEKEYESPTPQDAGGPALSRRPRKSNLSELLRPSLQEAIMNVMENTLEYTSKDFSLDRLASLVNSNSKYVSEVINDTYEKNFSNFVNEYRVHLACLRLADEGEYSKYTVRAIGESVGFNSYSTFTTVFRRHTGLTPSMYQAKIKEEKSHTDRLDS